MDTLELILPEDQSCKRRVSWTHQAGYSGNSFSIKLPTVYRDILHLEAKQDNNNVINRYQTVNFVWDNETGLAQQP